MARHDFQQLTDFAHNLIRQKARQLRRRRDFVRDDRADIEQELIARYLHRLPDFDPRRATLDAFAVLIVSHAVADVVRERRARRRDERGTRRLGAVDRDRLDERRRNPRLGRRARPAVEQTELALDVAEALERLSPDLRDVAERLKHWKVAEAARAAGVPRSTLSSRVRRLLQPLEELGLKGYLEYRSSP
jgi:RNA polymerase sigma-70 factor, ECF subfamily